MTTNSILDSLNEEQLKPAKCVEGPVLVTAGAGSGKTRLLTHRIAYMVKELGIAPYNILAITFTNKAANEMKERISHLVGAGAEEMWVCTFHAMCGRILRTHASKLNFSSNFTIYGDTEKNSTIKRLLNTNADYLNLGKEKFKPELVGWHISNAKNELLSPDAYYLYIKKDKFADIIIDTYKAYQKELLASNAIDFDDMLVKVYELFKTYPSVLDAYQERFKYIHIDEFQDTNTVQYELVKLMASKYRNIFAVGDEDQCIYSWRGAKFTNVQKLIDDFDGIKVFKLEQNYRSTKPILDTANKIIKNNVNRLEKNLWTKNSEGQAVKYMVSYSDLEEAEFVAQTIKSMVDDGASYSDFGVLMRINAISRVFEEKFLNYQIPYKVYGGFKFFERKEVKDLLAYLKLISNPKDNDSFIRTLQAPKKGIGDATIAKLLAVAKSLNMSAYDVARTGMSLDSAVIKKLQGFMFVMDGLFKAKEELTISELLTKIIKDCQIMGQFSKDDEEDYTRIANVENFEKSILEYEQANDNSSLEDYLQSVTLSRDIDEMSDDDNAVSLMTIHASKGLEFNIVFVVGLIEGVLPLSRAIYSMDKNEMEEERRLMYVATTRARQQLFLTRSSTKFNFETRRTEGSVPSRFLKEAGFESTPLAKTGILQNVRGGAGNFARTSFLDDDDEESEPKQVDKSKLDLYAKFKQGTRVRHKSFGEGVVLVEVTDPVGGFITIKFNSVGVKTLSLKFAPLEVVE